MSLRQRSSSPARMRDVAERAGVSLATVSRAFSTPELVSPETRERIDQAIRQLAYTVNINARSLRRHATGIVVVLLPDIGNPYFSLLLKGIEETASEGGRTVLIGDTAMDPRRGAAYANQLETQRADGMILVNGSLPFTMEGRSRAAAAHRPIVVVSEPIPGANLPTVGIDNVQAARDAIALLARLGHRRIAHIGGPPDNILTQHRQQGYHEGLIALGLQPDDGLMAYGAFSIESGRLATRRLLAANSRPTAVFASNDEMAIGAIIELKARGLAVPGDVSVVGFDDIEFAGAYDPALTTVRQPRRDMGRVAMSLLVDLLEQRRPKRREIMLKHEVVVRASTAAAR